MLIERVVGRRGTLILLTVSAVLGFTMFAPPASADPNWENDSAPGVSAGSAGAGDGSYVVSISVSSTSASGASSEDGGWSMTTTATALPVCWYKPDYSGSELAEYLRSEYARAKTELGRKQVTQIGELWKGWEEHADDKDGMWYMPTCDESRAPDDETYREISHAFAVKTNLDYIWVPAGQEPPAPVIDARTLVRAAMGAVRIPVPEVETNPRVTTGDGVSGATVVGLDTWVWATGETPSQVRVTASAGSLSATVVASASGLRVSAPDSVPSCTGWGSPWVPGQSQEGGSDCTVEFTRSSAHLGGTTPLTVSVGYDVAWTATDGTSGTLDPITTTSTTDLPVAEIQTINRDTSH